MKLIKDYIQLPSQAVQLMIDGLRNQSKRPDFQIDMAWFGYIKNASVCCGCAATCALQEMVNMNLTHSNIQVCITRAEATGISYADLDTFEYAIDSLRKGYTELFSEHINQVLGTNYKIPGPEEHFYLENHNWEQQLPLVEKYVEQLKAAGL